MKYRNRKTGNVIDVPCSVEGPDWEFLPEQKPAKKPARKKQTKEPDET